MCLCVCTTCVNIKGVNKCGIISSSTTLKPLTEREASEKQLISFFLRFVSMSAYHRQRLQEEHIASLEQRRNRLRTMLQEERERLEAELRGVVPDRSSAAGQLVQKTEELRTAREERRKKVVAFNQNLFFSADHGSTLP